jgi:hypothetical protein
VSRALRALAGLALALLAVALVLLFFSGRDEPTLEGAAALGEPYRGDPVLSPALEEAVALGNVVILHRDPHTPAGTRELAAGAGAELREEGLAVLFEREPTLDAALAAVSRDRILAADDPAQLRDFVDFQLGRAGR